jgi:hypothetical protein
VQPARETLVPGVDPLEPTDPRQIGAYRLIGRLGRGGMATVYLGEGRKPTGQLQAIKLIHPHLGGDAEFRARFTREVELARRVPDFCTAPVRADGEHEGRPYLVTDYLDGQPLHRLVLDEGPLDPAGLHSLAIGVAAALTAIHDSDLVHRDLKPSNVMVIRGGVRIIDFGIARALDLSTGYTASGLVMGSLGWASPEQLNGVEPTPAMDVFGWGCLVAYAATGEHPFGGADATTRSWRILHAEPNLDALSPWLAELVAAALVKSPDDRPNAQELLIGLVGGQPRRSGQHRVTPILRPAGVANLATEEDTGAERPRRGRRRMLFAAVPLVAIFGLGGVTAATGVLGHDHGGRPPVTTDQHSASVESAPAGVAGAEPGRPGASPDAGQPQGTSAAASSEAGVPVVQPMPPSAGTSTAVDESDGPGRPPKKSKSKKNEK